MIYELQIGVRGKTTEGSSYKEPISISTISNRNTITNEEIDLVTEAFSKQIKEMIKRLVAKED